MQVMVSTKNLYAHVVAGKHTIIKKNSGITAIPIPLDISSPKKKNNIPSTI